MALQKQTVRMAVTEGLDTKTDEKNVVATRFLGADNVVYTKTGSASKRFGYDRKPKLVLGASALTAANALTIYNEELLTYSNNALYTFSESHQKWINKGVVPFALSESQSIDNNNYRLLNPFMAVTLNLACYAYEEVKTTTSTRYSIVDNITNTTIFVGTISGATKPQVVALGGTFFIFTIESSNLVFRTIKYATPTAISSPITASVAASSVYDICTIGNRVYFAIPKVTSGINIGWVSIDSVVNGPISVSTPSLISVVSLNEEQTGTVRLSYGSAAGTLYSRLFNTDLNTELHVVASVAIANNILNITGVKAVNGSSTDIFLSSPSSVNTPARTKTVNITLTGVLGSVAILQNGAYLQSKAINFNGESYYMMSHDSASSTSNSDTLFLVSASGHFVAQYDPAQCPVSTTGNLTPLIALNNTLIFSASSISEFQVVGVNITVPTTVKKFVADFSTMNNYFDAQLGDNLHIVGGMLKMYDGNRVVEHGFLDVPPKPVFVSDTTTGGVLPNGVYQYIAVYAWKDKAGQLHRSAPSIPLSHTVSGGPKRVTVRIFNLALTEKTDVEIEVYRTDVNGTVFYKQKAGVLDIKINDKTSIFQDFQDSVDNTTLLSNEVLYTTGGTLDNIVPSGSKYTTTYKNRVFLISSDGRSLQYSKTREQNGPVEFNDALKIELDSKGGKANTLAVMDNNLIIFKEQAIFTISGEGPNNLGEQDDFRMPQLITSDAGCIDLNSTVVTPSGILFKSSKGIYMLGRDFNVTYIGAPVEAYNAFAVTSATLVVNTNQVRFTLENNKALVYDYFHQRWSTFSNISAVDACIYNGVYTYASPNADIMGESANFTDAGSFIPMSIESSWISLINIQGFERFYKMIILGSYKNSCKFKVSFAYDFNSAYTSEVIIDAGSILETPVYGEGVYGTTTPYGGNDPLFRWRIFPKIQKCDSFRFKIEDINSGVPGESFSLSNFAAEVGIAPPSYKLASAKSAAAK
jgi:hypothetical protein